MTNHNPAEQPQGVDTASIPHTGKLEGPMQELPTQEFDKTSLAEAHEQNLLTIPDSVALEQANHEEVKKDSSKKAVLGGVAAAGAIAIGVAGFALGSSGEEDPANTDGKSVVVDNTEEDNSINTPPSETTITVEESPVGSTDSGVDIDLSAIDIDDFTTYPTHPDGSPYSRFEVEELLKDPISPEARDSVNSSPVIMDAENPEDLLKQFRHNALCMLNNRDESTQQLCVEHIVGPGNIGTPIGQRFEEHAETSRSYLDEIQSDPNFVIEERYTLINSETRGNTLILTVFLEEQHFGPSNRKESYNELVFERVEALKAGFSSVDPASSVWVLQQFTEINH